MRIDTTNLNPELVTRLQTLSDLLDEHGLSMRITEGYRTPERQDQLYAQSRTAPGPWATNARGGESPHNYGMAVDLCFAAGDPYRDHDADWEESGALAEEAGLAWGGRFSTVDRTHVELTDWRDRARERRAGEGSSRQPAQSRSSQREVQPGRGAGARPGVGGAGHQQTWRGRMPVHNTPPAPAPGGPSPARPCTPGIFIPLQPEPGRGGRRLGRGSRGAR